LISNPPATILLSNQTLGKLSIQGPDYLQEEYEYLRKSTLKMTAYDPLFRVVCTRLPDNSVAALRNVTWLDIDIVQLPIQVQYNVRPEEPNLAPIKLFSTRLLPCNRTVLTNDSGRARVKIDGSRIVASPCR
jgi:hypothetical protein